jgi:hypothetical protein
MEYIIAAKSTIIGLEDIVRNYIKDGWVPQGGVTAVMDEDGVLFLQALVRDQGGIA